MAANEKPSSADSTVIGESLRVLVVEDDLDAQANLVDILELDGFAVECAATARQTLEKPDLDQYVAIILDRRLPDATAETLLPELRSRAPDAAVIVVTGFADVAGIVSAMREGAVDYIFKPVNVDLLRASVARVVETRRLGKAMQRSEMARQTLTEAVPCIVVSLRSDGSIAYFNDFAAMLTGHRAVDVLGRSFRDLLNPQVLRPDSMRRQPYDPLSDARTRDVEAVIQCADDSVRWTIWNWNTLDDADGAPLLLGVAQDITARKAAEERALHNERLAAIGQTMTGLVHESRNALQRSKACLEMLAYEIHDNPAATELLGRLQKAQEDLHLLFEEVREYAAPMRLELRPCDLKAVLREAWEHLADSHQRSHLRLCDRMQEGPLPCAVDRFKIGQVFRNVLENAIQASPPQGQITIESVCNSRDGAGTLRVAVRDEGPGLSEEQRQRIFEPFFTTKTKGTGLGMAICQRIVQAHGGSVSAGSNGGGAEIIICLPRGNQ